jgi:hypothetical protein
MHLVYPIIEGWGNKRCITPRDHTLFKKATNIFTNTQPPQIKAHASKLPFCPLIIDSHFCLKGQRRGRGFY